MSKPEEKLTAPAASEAKDEKKVEEKKETLPVKDAKKDEQKQI